MKFKERFDRVGDAVRGMFAGGQGQPEQAAGPYARWAQELAAERNKKIHNRDLYTAVVSAPLVQFRTTTDPDRTARELITIARLSGPRRRVVAWDSANAAYWLDDGGKMVPRFHSGRRNDQQTGQSHPHVNVERWESLQQIVELMETPNFPPSIFYLPDLHLVIDEPGQKRGMVDVLKRLQLSLRDTYNSIVIQTPPGVQLPPELEGIVEVVREVPLSNSERQTAVQRAIAEVSEVTGRMPSADVVERITDSMVGLNELQVTQALQFALVHHFDLDDKTPRLVQRFKENQLAASGYWEPMNTDDVPQLVGWGRVEDFVSMHHARGEAIPPLVFVGHAGVGKTTAARRIGQILGLRTYKAEVSRWMGSGIVGSLEQSFGVALHQARNAAPGVFLIDEFQRVIGGQASSNRSDAGSLNRGVGELMQAVEDSRQKEEPITWIFTANTRDEVPPEFFNRGMVFAVDFPDAEQRIGIFNSVYERLGRTRLDLRRSSDLTAAEVSAITNGMVGRDIEKLIRTANVVGSGEINAWSLTEAKDYIALQQDLDPEEVGRRADRMRGIPSVKRRRVRVEDAEFAEDESVIDGLVVYPAPQSPFSEQKKGSDRKDRNGSGMQVVHVTDD